MTQPIHKLPRAVLALCWLGAGAGYTSDEQNPSASPRPEVGEETKLCATFAMANGAPASVKVTDRSVQLQVPAALEAQGKMKGDVVFVDFDRIQHGKLECRYADGDNGLELQSCDEEVTAGALVSANRMTVRMGSAGSAARDVTVTACAAQVAAIGPMPANDSFPDFGTLPDGTAVRPTDQGIPLESEPVKFGMTGELQEQYRVASEKDPAVKKLLGERFAYSYFEVIEPPKGQEPDSIHVKLWFYSHARSISVWVELKDGVIQKSDESELLVPEAASEVQASVAMARKDPALRGRVNDLQGNAMLAVVPEGASWAGNRVLDVRFYDAGFNSHYMALVDLTTERVLEAGPVDK